MCLKQPTPIMGGREMNINGMVSPAGYVSLESCFQITFFPS